MLNVDDLPALERALAVCHAQRRTAEEGQQRLQMFLDGVEDYAFISFDLDGRIVGWSRGAEHILGYREVDALGLPSSIFFTPEDVLRGEDEREFLVAREAGRAEDERWHLRRDGVRFWGSGVMTRRLDADGRLCGYAKVMRDHTARRLAEGRLRDSEERLRLFSENVRDYALVPVDLEGLVVGWNSGAAGIFGYTSEEILGQHCARFFTPEDIAGDEPQRDLYLAATEGRSEYERWMVRADGSRFWAHWVTTPIHDDDDRLRGFAKVLHDGTDRKLAQELRERLQAQEQVSLRTQVRSTGEALDRTNDELRALSASLLRAQEDERRHIARELHDDLSQRLAVLAYKLAALHARAPALPAGVRGDVQRVETDVSVIAGEVRKLSHRLHPAILDDLGLAVALRRLVEEFDAGRSEPTTFIEHGVPETVPHDASATFYRIAQEALRNISKHANTGPVRVELDGAADKLCLTISDFGPGFDVVEARARGGLGIISMYERARLIGASLRLDSRPGEGTVLTLSVPVADA
ncbi:MAG TPA: PAS domain-containing sensor histidine kinase [Nannocystis sp.]|jgi:PAS domain S-box-containing protein